MDSSNKKPKATKESRKAQPTVSSDLSSDPASRRRKNEKGRYKNPSSSMQGATSSVYTDASEDESDEKGRYNSPSSFMEDATSSVYTDASGVRSDEKVRYKSPSSFMEEATSSAYTDASGSRISEKRRYRQPSSSMQGATSSAYTDASGRRSDEKEKINPKTFMEGATSAVYAVNMPGASFQTAGTVASELPSDAFSSDLSGGSHQSRYAENVRLMPFKVKDVMEMIKDNPTYKDKSPVMIKVKENDIDQILERQNVIRGKTEPLDKYFKQSPRVSPVNLQTSLKDEAESFRMSTGAESGRTKYSKESTQRAEKPFVDNQTFAGADRNQKIFAMPDVQAFPVVQTVPTRRSRISRRSTRSRSRRSRPRVSPAPRRRVSRPRRYRSRTAVRRVVRRPIYPRRHVSPCTTFPMCDDNCPISRPYRAPRIRRPSYSQPRPVVSNYNAPYYGKARPSRAVVSRGYNTPFTSSSRGLYYPDDEVTPVRSRVFYSPSRRAIRGDCCCNTCKEKLQFIQPGLCNKKKNVWTNEYAVIPKPQVHLIDPCEELDPSIYPRADNPCIRDGQGNPLTDCIGRPLRSPIGKRFLSFTANGSVMETSVRGNFWTGQPPLCVKCPMPSVSCGQDTTHNWWMSCGYPIMPNMNPFYKRVLAAEMGPC